MRQYGTQQPRRLGGLASRLCLAAVVAALPACGEHNPTDPEGTTAQAAAVADPLAVTATAIRLPKSFFVNPTGGNDANPGTNLKPFKTLAHGLSLAIAGDTMRLAIGVYSAASNGEKFTNGSQQVFVPAGVMILGTPGEAISQLQGVPSDTVGLNLKGTATVRNLIVRGFRSGIRGTQGVQTIKNVRLEQNILGLELSGSAKTTLVSSRVVLVPRPNSAATVMGAFVSQQAQLTVVGGTIGGPVQNCTLDMRGVSLRDAARLTMKNGATIKDVAGMGLAMFGTSKATLTGLSTIDRSFTQLAGGCSPSASVFATDFSTLTLKNARVLSAGGTKPDGIVANTSGLVTLDSAQVKGHLGIGLKSILNLSLVATASVFQLNGVGIDVFNGPNSNITITGSTLSNNGIGIHAPFFKLRKSLVTSNRIGISVAGFSSDLGQTSDPGNNLIAGNLITGVTWDANVISGGVGGIFASGNTWNPSTQGSDANGHYLTKPLLNNDSPSASGKSFVLPAVDLNDLFQIQL
jgi:Protein of unknown function (DUF1565)